MGLSVGAKVGRYTVERLLGHGGMAEVWSVRHNVLGNRYALKVLHQHAGRHRQRLLQEGRAQAQLDHPNILTVRDILDVNGQPALLLPLVDGPPLTALLNAQRLSPAVALAIFKILVGALTFAHGRGFVHRDLKPANILLDVYFERLRPRVADFGLVKHDGGLQTRTGSVMGTPAYAAPEQLRDATTADARADWFSLGVILVELLTGVRPFIG
ncbi:MAG: serine/threonine-protein kinase, partial [Myxococcota bacterium]